MTGSDLPGRPVAQPWPGAPLPDLRSLVPPGGPPPLPPLRSGLSRDERKARSQHQRDRAKFVSTHRQDPLPPGVWVVRANARISALRVLAPGRIEVWRGGDHEPQPFAVVGMKRGWWRGSRLKFLGPDGTKQVIRTVNPGSAGLADVGDPEPDNWNFGDDPLSSVLAVVALIAAVFMSPWLIAQAVRRRRTRNEIARVVRPPA